MNNQEIIKKVKHLVREYNFLNPDPYDAMLYDEAFLTAHYANNYKIELRKLIDKLAEGELKNLYIRKDGVIVISITNDKREEKIAGLFPDEYKRAQIKDNCFVLMISTKE